MNSRDLVVLVLAILAALILLPVLGMSIGGAMMMGWMGGFGLLILVLVITGVALIALGLFRRTAGFETPLDVLKRRLAAGEITKDQYEELRRILQRKGDAE